MARTPTMARRACGWFIVRLRKRFERDADAPRHFHTVRGVGYRFTAEPAAEQAPPPPMASAQ